MLQLDLGTDYADYTDFFYDPIFIYNPTLYPCNPRNPCLTTYFINQTRYLLTDAVHATGRSLSSPD